MFALLGKPGGQQQRDYSCQKKGGPQGPTQTPIFRATIQVKRHAHAHHINNRNRNQKMPAQLHQLVEAIARKCKPQPQEKVKINSDLEQEPERAVQTRASSPRICFPPAQTPATPAPLQERNTIRRQQPSPISAPLPAASVRGKANTRRRAASKASASNQGNQTCAYWETA